MLRRILLSPRFVIAELLLIVLSGVIWVFIPELGIWFTVVALLPWGLRMLVGEPPFQRTPLDLLMVILLITAWVGYWAAYDKTSAWIKVWLIVTAVLLYYVFSEQPKQNLGVLSLFSFNLGLAVSIYFFLTHGFTGSPGSMETWWMEHRPQLGWTPIHHGYICGLLVITNLFALYWLREIRQKHHGRLTLPLLIFISLGLGMVLLTFLLTVSRGVWMAMALGLGVWIIWRIINSNRFSSLPGVRSLFPFFVLGYLCIILVLAYLGPARVAGGPGESSFGNNSRAELTERGAYFLLDYPITGGGLNSFPGLYSQYMLGIPQFYFINSYNLFLDVAIEQGIIGGLAFLLIYFGAIWLVSRTLIVTQAQEVRYLSWLSLFALIFTVVHGFFYDYLYNGSITPLLLFPVGFSMIGVLNSESTEARIILFPAAASFMRKYYMPLILLPVIGLVALLVPNTNKIISIWYSDLGAVQMSQAELRSFPTNQWATVEMIPRLETAEISLRSALQYNPNNQTANYRLGMISLLRQDFESASTSLETAYKQAPGHRGIIKNLGYAYVWLGKLDKAKRLLGQIPEAQEELNVYSWWWNTQGRHDLSEKASDLASGLNSTGVQY